MPTIKDFDNYASTLASAYTAGGVALSLTAAGTGASALPSAGDYYLVVDPDLVTEEIFKVTTGTSGSGPYAVTAAGAQAGTTNQNHASGAVVKGPILTRAALDQMRADASRSLTTAAFDALAAGEYQKGDRIKLNDSCYEAYYNGSAWEYYYGSLLVTRPPSSGWTWDNPGSSAFDTTNGYLYASCVRTGATSLRALYRTAPAAPYTITALLNMDLSGGGNTASTGDSTQAGLILRDSSGKIIRWNVGSDAGYRLITQKWTTTTSGPSDYRNYSAVANIGLILSAPIWMRITDDNTNLIFYYSIDGQHWKQFDTRARTLHFASGPTQIGIGGYASGNDAEIQVISWG